MRQAVSVIEERLDEATAKGLAAAVGRAVRDGALAPGQQLPPIRELAHQLALSPTTVSAAWTLLGRAGTIRTAGRRGTRVAHDERQRDGRYRQVLERTGPSGGAVHGSFELDLSTGVPDAALLPPLESALRHLGAAGSAGTPHSYLDDPVLPPLRDALVADWPYAPPALTVVDGAMDGLELVIRAQLRYGDRVVVEHPSFPPLLDLLEAAGVEVDGVPLDEEGLRPQALATALASPARAVFLQPRAQNPTGVCTSTSRLEQLADVLAPHAERGLLVVEDDSASGISAHPDLSLGTHLPGSTVHVRSYSKAYGPDLRLAALSGPAPVVAAVEHLRQLGQGWSSRLLQRVLLGLLQDHDAVAAVAVARRAYAARRDHFCAALAEHGVDATCQDGLNVWVPVLDESATTVRLASRGIGVAPGAPFAVLDDPGHVRVTVGLLDRDDDLERVAAEVAAAARTAGRRVRR